MEEDQRVKKAEFHEGRGGVEDVVELVDEGACGLAVPGEVKAGACEE